MKTYNDALKYISDRTYYINDTSNYLIIEDNTHRIVPMKIVKTMYEDINYKDDDGSLKSAFKLWNKTPEYRKKISELVYNPSIPYGHDNGVFNTYIQPKFDKLKRYNADLFINHIKLIANCNDKWLIGWMASLVQRPYVRCMRAPYFHSKSKPESIMILEDILRALVGEHNFYSTRRLAKVTGVYNGCIQDKILISIDLSDAYPRKQIGALRSLITDDKLVINLKGKEIITVDNPLNFMIYSNHRLRGDMDDERRFAPFYVGNILEFTNYMKYMEWLKQGDGYTHIYNYLMDVDLKRFKPYAKINQFIIRK